MAFKILITGGSGLVGAKLSYALKELGHEVSWLSRSSSTKGEFPTYKWDAKKRYIDETAFDGVTHIVHLAGAGVADERWTVARKREILDSRVQSATLLHEYVSKLGIRLDQYISASAIGIYGDRDEVVNEESDRGEGFLADVVEDWEQSADLFADVAGSVSKVRVGIVLDQNSGALPKMAMPVKYGVGAPLGSGKQMMSWIHIDDMVGVFRHVISNDLSGVYNGVAPYPVSNAELTKSIAKQLNKPLWLPNVPAFVLKLALGELSSAVLDGVACEASKIQSTGYSFKFGDINAALADLL